MRISKDPYCRALAIFSGLVLLMWIGFALLPPPPAALVPTAFNVFFALTYGPLFLFLFLQHRDNQQKHKARMKQWKEQDVLYRKEADERESRWNEQAAARAVHVREEDEARSNRIRQRELKEMQCKLIHLLELP